MAGKNEGPATYTGKPKASKKLYDWGDGRKVHTVPKPKAKADTGGYAWEDGRNVHSVTMANRDKNRALTASYGVSPQTPLDQPLSTAQAYAMAQATADRTYAPQLQANKQLQVNTPAWYQNYVTETGKQQQAAQAYAQPILNTAQTAVTNAGATAPGLDPSSPQYAKEQQAAQGRTTMAQDSANYLAGVAAATNAYFGGQANVAQRELPQVQAGLTYQGGQLASQREGAVTDAYGQIRTGEQNASIARQTLGLNTASAAADVDLKRGIDPVTGKALPADAPTGYSAGGPGQNKYGYTYDEWKALPESKKAKARAGNGTTGKTQAQKDAEKQAAADAKKKTTIKTATGGVKTKVTDLMAEWDSYKGQQTDDTSKPADAQGNYPPRPITPSDIKKILGAKSKDNTPGLIHVMLLVRTGKALDKAAIDYLHAKDPNIRIPREWLRGTKRTSSTARPPNAPDSNGQSRPT